MITQNSMSNCRFCCVVSKANGEDPIGSALTYEHFLAMEMALPWTEKRLHENPVFATAIALIEKLILVHGIKIRGQLLVPDSEYSRPGYTCVLYYRRPAKLFAKFEKHEFMIPDTLVGSFVIELLETLSQSPIQLPDWEQYRQQTSHIRELMVCTDGNVDIACARFGHPIYHKLRSEFATLLNPRRIGKDESKAHAKQTCSTNEGEPYGQLRVWRCSHIGGHQFAPTLIDFPYGHYWGHLQPEILELLVWHNGSVTELYPFYRGWAGLSKFEQIVEREIWIQEGWDWLDYQKAGQVLASDEVNQDWALVRIDFTTTDGSMRSAYEARVEVSKSVMTAWNSADEQPLEEVKQYRVSHLVKMT